MWRSLTCWMVLLVCPSVALSQNDRSAVADVVSIEDRPGYMKAFRQIAEGEEDVAIETLLRILERHGEDPDSYMARYNIACAHARKGRADTAMDWLRQATAAGYGLIPQQLQNLQIDPDLEGLRGTPEFTEVVNQAGQRYVEMTEGWEEYTRSFVFVPETAEERTEPWPVLILLHGFADQRQHFAEQFVPFAQEHGFVLLAPCAPHQISPDRWTWFYDTGEFIDRFRQETRNIWLAKQQLTSAHPIDPQRIYVIGTGQGAALGFGLVNRNPQWVRGAVLFGGGYAPAVMTGWLQRAPQWGRRIQLVHGENDPIWPLDPLQKFVILCGEYDLPVRLDVHPGAAGLPADFERRLGEALAWIDSGAYVSSIPSGTDDDYERMPQIDGEPETGPEAGTEGHDHDHEHGGEPHEHGGAEGGEGGDGGSEKASR